MNYFSTCIFVSFYPQKLKLNDFVSPSQLPDLRKTIYYGRKSIGLRKGLPGTYHRVRMKTTLILT